MRVVVALVVGYLAARVVWLITRPSFAAPALARSNYRGRMVPTAAGVLIPVAAFAVEAGRIVAGSLDIGPAIGVSESSVLALLAAAGFALFGVIDDVVGTAEHQGFKGHIAASLQGQPTTGLLKIIGGGCVAIAVVVPIAGGDTVRLLADAALVALAANLGNLLDRAPGRTIKSAAVAFAVLAGVTRLDPVLATISTVVGAGLGLLIDDLHERLMLGDAGSNVLGAVIGLGVVFTAAPAARNVVLLVLIAFNVAGELVSFSRVIEAVPPLRALDRVGRRR